MTWDALTVNPSKSAFYADEPVCRELMDDLTRRTDPVLGALRVGVLVLKPEAIRRRCAGAVLKFLETHGLVPLAAAPVRIRSATSQLLWHYQWVKATSDRMRLHCLMGADSDSVVIIVTTVRATPVPPSVQLWTLKGSTDPLERRPDQLRSMVGMSNRMIAFIHCSDEPADVLRDLAILWPLERRTELIEIFAALASERGAYGYGFKAEQVISRVSRRSRPHPVELQAALDALRCRAPQSPLIPAVGGRQRWPLSDVWEAFGVVETQQQLWDLFVLAAELIRHDIEGVLPLIDPGDVRRAAKEWTRCGLR